MIDTVCRTSLLKGEGNKLLSDKKPMRYNNVNPINNR